MTELMILLGFLTQLAKDPTLSYPGVNLDIDKLTSITDFIRSAKADSYFREVITDLCRLDDAIVVALANHGENKTDFVFLSSVFAKKKGTSTLPRFLYGLLTTIFFDNGKLRLNFCQRSVECLLVALRLVRRSKHSSFTRIAADTAAQKFISQQVEFAPANGSTLEEISELWESFESLSPIKDSIVLGFPGNGVCIDMQLPYVPDFCFIRPLDNESIPPSTARVLEIANSNLFDAAGLRTLGNSYHIPSTDYVGVYPVVPNSVSKLSIVPKKFDEGRAITTAYVGNTILGATCRQSIFEHHRLNGTISMVNVKDQGSSARVLQNHFASVSCLDLKGGSSCLTTDRLDIMLSKTTVIKDMWQSSRPSQFSWKGEVYDLRVLTMGDAASVALLTTTLWLCCVLAVMRVHRLDPYSFSDFQKAIAIMKSDDRFRVVGDDMIVPNRYLVRLRQILKQIGVVINERKSSGPNSLHKESCGAWFVKHKHATIPTRIYPFRAAVGDTHDLESVTQLVEQYVDKNYNSTFSRTLFHAHTLVLLPLDERLKFESLLSRSSSHVGTPFGSKWSNVLRINRPTKQVVVDDSLAYVRGISESLITPRYRRATFAPRLSFRKKADDYLTRSSKQHHLTVFFSLLLLAKVSPTLTTAFANPRFKSAYSRFSKPNIG